MIVVDSDVLIDSLRGQETARGRIDLELRSGHLATTAVTVFELTSGCRTERLRETVEALLAPLKVLPFGARAARIASQLRLDLEAKGKGIAMADYLIAGICLAHDALLLTRNVEHFRRCAGLKLGRLALE